MDFRYLASGDGPFYYKEQVQALSWLPPIWEAFKGFGENLLPRLWIDYPFRLIVKILSTLGLTWWMIEKLLWIGALILGVYSMYRFGRKFAGAATSWIGCMIYMVNTYTLLLFGGGQLGMFFAYGYVPYVLLRFTDLIDTLLSSDIQNHAQVRHRAVINGLVLGLLVVFDLRVAYITFIGIAMYYVWIFFAGGPRRSKKAIVVSSLVSVFVIPIGVTVAIHAFWILPMVVVGGGPSTLSPEFTGTGILKFLSVADFSHTVSLLHPNWPENLFGKVYFLQPEFLVIPFLAFTSLLFIEGLTPRRSAAIVMFFAVLALVGSFLAKGVNAPLGGVYQWIYQYVPGFVMFRDSTKFYIFIALGYAVLIPFSLSQIQKKINNYQISLKGKVPQFWLHVIGCSVAIIFIIFWLFTIRAVFTGQLSGNFQTLAIPNDFITLKSILLADKNSSRVLWMPTQEKFAFASDLHPVLTGNQLFDHASPSAMIQKIHGSDFHADLYEAGVKYIVVPHDIGRRIFLDNYAVDSRLREGFILALANSGFERDKRFEHLAVFVNSSFRFQEYKPAIVPKQEYWSRVGLVVSGVSLLACMIFVKVKKIHRV